VPRVRGEAVPLHLLLSLLLNRWIQTRLKLSLALSLSLFHVKCLGRNSRICIVY
jgi:hypothetical protein